MPTLRALRVSFRKQLSGPFPPPDAMEPAFDAPGHVLRARTARGGVAVAVAQASTFAFQFVATVWLARLLTPADFGLVAMVTAITGFALLFSDFGLSAATIQASTLSHQQASNVFWMNVCVGAALTVAMAGLSPLIAYYY